MEKKSRVMDSSKFENKNAIEVKNLTKIYHGNVRAVDDVSFSVREGEIFGLLGPNGAGKTTMIKMIVTLTRSTAGVLQVFGIDSSKSPETVRSMLGYVPQSVSVDADLTGYENLLIFSKLSYVGKKERDERILEALEYMGLTERAKDLVKHYSGGMMRRLEISQALVNRPRILLLDEPSIGLDPASKMHVWESIKQLKKKFGTTVLITTHDMNEADELCDRIAIMSDGKISVLGNPADLKKSVGGDMITVHFTTASPNTMFPKDIGTIMHNDEKSIQILAENGEMAIPLVTNFYRDQKISIDSISINKPNLDDVFMKYAKRRLHDEVSTHASNARRDLMRHIR
ncbi:MAG: ATP-binding cassette domain-containing protein [Thaumarchaeota archaeon]|nr:ATP-binding cassette domain-containing protein [Nitrososphaerota archaeon]MDE1839814.1 ATP-binding cassette domain-containing protein [Nitrososphaerota archaeon]